MDACGGELAAAVSDPAAVCTPVPVTNRVCVSDHVYANVVGMPFIKDYTNVYKDKNFAVDIINGDAINVWEPPDRTFCGTIKTYNWTELKDHFDVNEVPTDMVEAYTHAKDLVHKLAPVCGRISPFLGDRYDPISTASNSNDNPILADDDSDSDDS
jgi:hypothetical protein